MKTVRKILSFFFVLLIVVSLYSSEAFANEVEFLDTTPFEGKRIGVSTGTVYATTASDYIDNAELYFYSASNDSYVALNSNKIDAIIDDYPVLSYLASQVDGLSVGMLNSVPDEIAEIFAKNDRGSLLCSQYNEFLSKLRDNGELDDIKDLWLSGSKAEKLIMDYALLPDTNGTIIIASSFADPPYTYTDGSIFHGYEIDLAVRFCQEYGYKPQFESVSFDGIITGVAIGKFDMGVSDFSITEERKQSVYFSDPIDLCYAGLAYPDKSSSNTSNLVTEFFDATPFNGKRVGVQSGSVYANTVTDFVDEPEIYYYPSNNDSYLALESNKIDAFIGDLPVLAYLSSQVDDLSVGTLDSSPDEIAAIFAKNDHGSLLCSQYNEFLSKLSASGELDEIKNMWFYAPEDEKQIMDYTLLPDTNGTLVIASSAAYPPYEYIKDDTFCGYELDLVVRFCQEYGYKPQIENVSFDGIIAGVVSGKFDMGASGFSITEERKQSVNFSTPFDLCYAGIAYPKEISSSTTSAIKDSFTKTFIKESRWKMFLSGCFITLKISILSIFFGTLLGFAIHILCRNNIKIAQYISRVCEWLISGTPVVVLLMIFYYVILGNSSLDGISTSILCFTLIFASSMHSMLVAGEKAVDPGQSLAAKALGYTKSQTFFSIILPQAARHFLPSYLAEVSSHIKATAVVGYIAVVDLTKVGDLVRSRTYEAFFPLIAITVLYFILVDIIKLLIKLAAKRLDPTVRSQKQILKGASLK